VSLPKASSLVPQADEKLGSTSKPSGGSSCKSRWRHFSNSCPRHGRRAGCRTLSFLTSSISQLMTICRLSRFGRVWHEGYGPFARQGSDTFMVVSAGGNILWTCDPDTILQFSKRNYDFVKPVEMMGMLNMYGPTVTATEGDESRIYRKTAAPCFNDRTHGSAWTESLGQTSALLRRWASLDTPITQLNEDAARLTLQVLSYVCFDRQMEWAEATGRQDELPKGHTMSYRGAISSMVDNISILFIVPPPLLSENKMMQGLSLANRPYRYISH